VFVLGWWLSFGCLLLAPVVSKTCITVWRATVFPGSPGVLSAP
jgi:hypothetical protein